MTDTGGTPGGEGAGTPTPSQGIPSASVPGSGEPKPPQDHAASPATPPPGWQAPDSPGTADSPGSQGAQAAPGSPSDSGSQPAPPSYGSQPPPSYGSQVAPPPGWQAPGPPAPSWQPPGTYGAPQYGRPDPRWNPQGFGKPGVIALRPLNIGDILDGAITAIRRHPLLILGIGAVLAVITAGLDFLVQKLLFSDLQELAAATNLGPGATDEEISNALFGLLGTALLATLPTALLTTLLAAVANGLLAAVMGRAVLGREVTFSIAWAEVWPRMLPLLGVGLAYSVLTTIGAMLCLIPGVVVYVFWALASPALVLERGTFKQAFSRSVKLVSGSFWRVLGILLLAWLIGYLFSMIINLPFNVGTGMFRQLFNPAQVALPTTGDLLLQSAGQIIAGTIAMPFVALVTVIVYLDQRMRREGMDIELARAAGVQPPQAW